MLQCVAMCGSVLQIVAVRVLQFVAVLHSRSMYDPENILQCVAVCCSALQRVAVCSSVLQ